jgi:NADH:ubiquinone oxidoreductase subunit C
MHDAVGYCHNFNIFTITQNFVDRGVITTYNINLLKHSQNVILLTTPETKKDAISSSYPSATFYEREVQEMFGLRLRNLRDSRALLLDYLTTNAPFIKEQPVWGVEELAYSKSADGLCVLKNNIFSI